MEVVSDAHQSWLAHRPPCPRPGSGDDGQQQQQQQAPHRALGLGLDTTPASAKSPTLLADPTPPAVVVAGGRSQLPGLAQGRGQRASSSSIADELGIGACTSGNLGRGCGHLTLHPAYHYLQPAPCHTPHPAPRTPHPAPRTPHPAPPRIPPHPPHAPQPPTPPYPTPHALHPCNVIRCQRHRMA